MLLLNEFFFHVIRCHFFHAFLWNININVYRAKLGNSLQINHFLRKRIRNIVSEECGSEYVLSLALILWLNEYSFLVDSDDTFERESSLLTRDPRIYAISLVGYLWLLKPVFIPGSYFLNCIMCWRVLNYCLCIRHCFELPALSWFECSNTFTYTQYSGIVLNWV